MKTPHQRVLLLALNLIAFQVAWFACVLGAAHHAQGPGIAVAAAAVGLQFVVSDARGRDVLLVVAAMAIGLGWDTFLARANIVEYASPGPFVGWAPAWILALWALFATMLRKTLRWLHGRRWLAAIVGGVGGALSYWGAVRLGAGRLPNFAMAMGVLAGAWVVITPGLTEFARWLDARR